MAIRMTRAEYEAKYGQKPESAPIRMTQKEFDEKYGTAQPAPQQEQGLYGSAVETGRSFSTGFTKGILSTGLGLGKIGQDVLNQTAGRAVNAAMGKGFTPLSPDNVSLNNQFSIYNPQSATGQKAQQFVTPQGMTEQAGYGTEKLAEFFIPALKTAKAEKAIDVFSYGVKKLPGISQKTTGLLTRILGKAGLAGVEAGAVTAAQTGGDLKKTTETALTAGVLRGGLATIGEGARALKIPERLYQTIFNNSKNDMLAELKEGGIQTLRARNPEVFKDYVKKGIIKVGEDNVPILNETLAERALDMGLRGSIKNMSDEVVQGIFKSEDDVRTVLGNYAGKVDVSEKQYINVLKGIAQEYEDVGFGEISKAANKLVQEIADGGGQVSGTTALEIRRLLDKARIARSFDVPATKLSLSQANLKSLADTLRNRLNSIENIGDTMKNYSFYIDALDALAAQAKRRGNNQVLGLIDTLFLSGGISSGAAPQGALMALMAKYLRSGSGTTAIAQTLKNSAAGTVTSGSIGGASSAIQSLLPDQTELPQENTQSLQSSPDSINVDEVVKETYQQMPKFDPTGAMGVGGMAARAGAKAAAPILKEAAQVAEQMSIKTYRLVKAYLGGAKANTEMQALNEVAKLEPALLKASLEDIKSYFKSLAKAYEDSIGN